LSTKPEIGQVICYDYLWKGEQEAGRTEGVKDRPCAIVIASNAKTENHYEVVVCPITHTPPHRDEKAVELPYKVCRHLGLDEQRMWIKTREINLFLWEEGCYPHGITRTPQGNWAYGILPYGVRTTAINQVMDYSQKQELAIVRRDDEMSFEEYRAMVDRKEPERTDAQRVKNRDREEEQ
jgi:hypothetical protein